MKVFRFFSCFLLGLSFPTAALGNPYAPGYPQRDQPLAGSYMQEKIRFPEMPPLRFSEVFKKQGNPVAGSYFGDDF